MFLKCFPSILPSHLLQKLKDHNIRTICDFVQEAPENINKITNLNFKEILDIKEKLLCSYRGSSYSGLQLYKEVIENKETFSSGIPAIDNLVGKIESGVSYEICGLSGSGKTQICLRIAATASQVGRKVYFIDTKNDFSARKIYNMMLRNQLSKEEIMTNLSQIMVTKVCDMYQLISALHSHKTLLTNERCPLIIIDCISTLYYLCVGLDEPIGLGLLNHVASLIRYLTASYYVTMILTNSAVKYYTTSEMEPQREKIKPSLGNYWLQVCDVRINTSKMMNSTNTIILEKDKLSFCQDLNYL